MTSWKKIVLLALSSLFLQVLHWLLYQWIGFSAGFLALTPMLLCAGYHIYQSDTVQNRGIGRKPVFFGTVLIPLVIGILVSLGMFLHNPDMSLYHPSAMPENSVSEVAALYAGRVVLTSGYLLVFSGIDCLLLHLQDKHREQKKTGEAI